jgi:hypothetical protein
MTLLFDAGDYSLGQRSIGGIGLRVAELAAALSAHFPVRIYSPATGNDEPVKTGSASVATEQNNWQSLLADATATFFFDMPCLERIRHAVAAGKLIVSESSPPIEQLDYPQYRRSGSFNRAAYERLLDAYRYQLAWSRHFIARSNVERLTLIANLCLSGSLSHAMLQHSRRIDHVITTVPIGFSEIALTQTGTGLDKPSHRRELLWAGGLWEYMNPVAAVRGVARARQYGTNIPLRFLHAAPHQDTAQTIALVRDTARDFGVEDLVYLHTAPVAHRERDAHMRTAAAFVCLARPGIENETCVRLRVRDSRLYGLRLLVDHYGATAIELTENGLAVVVDPADTDAVATHMTKIVAAAHNGAIAEPADKAQWTYERTTMPLVEYLHSQLT